MLTMSGFCKADLSETKLKAHLSRPLTDLSILIYYLYVFCCFFPSGPLAYTTMPGSNMPKDWGKQRQREEALRSPRKSLAPSSVAPRLTLNHWLTFSTTPHLYCVLWMYSCFACSTGFYSADLSTSPLLAFVCLHHKSAPRSLVSRPLKKTGGGKGLMPPR